MKKMKTDKKILNLGCGESVDHDRDKEFKIDIMEQHDPDLVWDLRKTPWPIADNQFELVYAENIIEHLPDTCAMMEEIWRVSKPGALVKIIVPHYTGYVSWSCPEHYKTFSSGTFRYFDKQFEEVDLKLRYFVSGRHKILSAIIDPILNLHFGFSDRFGALFGGISEVKTTLKVKKAKANKGERLNRPSMDLSADKPKK